jgi:RNA recognition motif-containing protein
MAKTLYVGNLSYETTEDELRKLFGEHGNVESVRLISDKFSGRSRGFAFVEMPDAEADAAMQALDGTEFMGRSLTVTEAKPRPERRSAYG